MKFPLKLAVIAAALVGAGFADNRANGQTAEEL